ncbi:hypothetical protein GCM10017764_10760 [Sphingobacterium griseoflavum]|uniref:beta-N-acetylhexosaminidase n=2 Tax=Sphingobacterium griseoflavum TaxID=1474952 RepID=A0ABQ3HS93_9SPHI|nr:hypothetical protein GCM10017764_10760 [Sphingobacterium griseoflavum]
MEVKNGDYRIGKETTIVLKGANERDVSLFAELVRNATGYALPIKKKSKQSKIRFEIDEELDVDNEEGYTLDITATEVVVKAKTGRGIFYGSQTLRQLCVPAVEAGEQSLAEGIVLPQLAIRDFPRFSWRGYMQDVSRTFYDVEFLKKYMDVLALYKMNTLHLHLTDDQGWRLEIKKYPELTSPKTTVFAAIHQQPATRSGYYTQAQIKELIAYGAERHITIVPEIDVPGHCWPIILTHPELGTNKVAAPDYVFPFRASWGYWGFQFTPNPLDPTNEKVYDFLDNIFAEVAQLFPSKYIHFGGDEVVHRLWEEEPHVQAFMREKGMAKVEELQSYFVTRVSNMIHKRGKQPIGWNDILADASQLPKSTAIMSWLGAEAVKQAAKNGFHAVATPAYPLYFDITQRDRHDGTMADLNYGGANTIENVYAYDPHADLTQEEKKFVLGIQANMWPAVPQEVKDVNVQNFPRLLAVAEIGWTSVENKNVADFLRRLDAHYARLDELKIDYYQPGGYIVGQWDPSQVDPQYRTATWDVTDRVYANGAAQAGFFYTKGKSYLKVKNVKLLENGQVIAEDTHEALADKFRGIPFKKDMFFYSLAVNHFNAGATYTLQADIAGDSSNESWGNVTFNLSPYKPFRFTEKPRN